MKHLARALTLAAAMAATANAAPSPHLPAGNDRQAIEQLMTGDYPRALDGHHWADYAALFLPDAPLSFAGQTLRGPAAIEKFFVSQDASQERAAPPSGRTLHVVTNVSIHIVGNTATAGAYWQTIGLRDGQPGVLSAGHYEDALRKVAGRWRFASRAIVTEIAATPATPAPAPR